MAKKKTKSVTQSDVDGFVKYILTPQAELNIVRRSGGFFKKGDENPDNNPLIDYYINDTSYSRPFNMTGMLLNKKNFRKDITPKQIKTIDEALYLAANNPQLEDVYADVSSMFATDLRRKKISPKYLSTNIGPISEINKQMLSGTISKSEAIMQINGLLQESVSQDLPNIVFDSLNTLMYRAEDEGLTTSGMKDERDARGDLQRLLKDVTQNPVFFTPDISSGYGALEKSRNAMKTLANFGYDADRAAQALYPRQYAEDPEKALRFLSNTLESFTGFEEYTQDPTEINVAPQLLEGLPSESNVPGYTYFTGGEGALGYVNPAGERMDMIDDSALRQAAQMGEPIIGPEDQIIYEKFGEKPPHDFSQYGYGMSPKIQEIISKNPAFLQNFPFISGVTPADYGLEMQYFDDPRRSEGGTN